MPDQSERAEQQSEARAADQGGLAELTNEEFLTTVRPVIAEKASELYYEGAKIARRVLRVVQWRGKTIDCIPGNDTEYDVSGTVLGEMLKGWPRNRRWDPRSDISLFDFHYDAITKEVRNRADRAENTTRATPFIRATDGEEFAEEEAREWSRVRELDIRRFDATSPDPQLHEQEYAVYKRQLAELVIKALPPGYELAAEIIALSIFAGVTSTTELAKKTRTNQARIAKERKRLARLMKDSQGFKKRLEQLARSKEETTRSTDERGLRPRPGAPNRNEE